MQIHKQTNPSQIQWLPIMLCLFYFESSWSLLKLADVEKVGRTETRGELGGV